MTDLTYGGDYYRPELAPTTPEPAPISLPIEDDGGELPRDFPQVDPAADARQTGEPSSGPLTVNPVPLIGAIPFGGVVLGAGQLTIPPGQFRTIGVGSAQRPLGTMIRVTPVTGIQTDVVAVGGQLARGFTLWDGAQTPFDFPVANLTLQNFDAADCLVKFVVIGYPVQAS